MLLPELANYEMYVEWVCARQLRLLSSGMLSSLAIDCTLIELNLIAVLFANQTHKAAYWLLFIMCKRECHCQSVCSVWSVTTTHDAYFLDEQSLQSVFADRQFSLLPHAFVTTAATVVPKMSTTIHNEIWWVKRIFAIVCHSQQQLYQCISFYNFCHVHHHSHLLHHPDSSSASSWLL